MDKLKKLGYTDYFHEFAESAEFKGCHPARVIAEHRGLYIVNSGSGELSAKVTGNMIFSASSREDYPAVGDFVLIETVDNEHAAIKGVMPRRTILKRKMVGKEFDMQIIATNIDTAFIIQAPDRDYNLNRIERYMALARSGEIETAIILNKTDIADRLDLENKMNELKERFPGTAIYGTSFVTGEGIEKLSADIKSAHTYCFIGSSGVGKSSIINMLLGNKVMKTGEKSVERGKHVTTHRHLFILANGGLLIDTPGMREIAPLE
ncbi:MAG: ribosome small subunit-dependent GTPase A, partial [bacterium]